MSSGFRTNKSVWLAFPQVGERKRIFMYTHLCSVHSIREEKERHIVYP